MSMYLIKKKNSKSVRANRINLRISGIRGFKQDNETKHLPVQMEQFLSDFLPGSFCSIEKITTGCKRGTCVNCFCSYNISHSSSQLKKNHSKYGLANKEINTPTIVYLKADEINTQHLSVCYACMSPYGSM